MDSFELNKIIAAVLLVALIIIGIGKPNDSELDYDRSLYLSKNKLTGEHVYIPCFLNHLLSRYE